MKQSKESHLSNVPRIVGRETEYTTALKAGDLLSYVADVPVLDGTTFSSNCLDFWTPNGGRLYADVRVLEFATPECLSGREVELHSRVGEFMVNSLVGHYQSVTDTSGNPYDFISASKRSGYVGVYNSKQEQLISAMSTGQHENYSSLIITNPANEVERERHVALLSSYLSTRGVWAGAGIVAGDGFRTTQKFGATRFNGWENKLVHGVKIPFIRHSGENRLEIRTGDGNMSSEVAIAVIDNTSLVLRMIEHNTFPKGLLVMNPDRAMRDSSIPGALINTHSGEMTAATHQKLVAEAALEFASCHDDTPKHEIAAAERVVSVCDDIELFDGSTGALELIKDNVEWAAKLWRIRKYVGEEAIINTANLNVVRRDLDWENISPKRSPSRKWFARHGDVFTEAEILRAVRQPPRTRALARVALLQSRKRATHVDWYRISVDGEWHYQFDPYNCTAFPAKQSQVANSNN